MTYRDRHDGDTGESLPADQAIQRDESEHDLEWPRPRNLTILRQIGDSHSVDTLQVDNVSCGTASFLSVAHDQRLLVD
jgi:hypothetical protein